MLLRLGRVRQLVQYLDAKTVQVYLNSPLKLGTFNTIVGNSVCVLGGGGGGVLKFW